MKVPFTVEEFMEVFKNYNMVVFPMQGLLYLFAIMAIYFSFKKTFWSDKAITLILSFLWIWMGIFYHVIFFAAINKVAYLFGAIFILQAIFFLWQGIFLNKLSFRFDKTIYSTIGIILGVFALVIYPVIGYSLGHKYPASATFGLPCPTTIFTFGMLLMTDKKFPLMILPIPFLWGILGFNAALSLGMKEDIGLFIATLFATGLLVIRNRKIKMI